MCDKSINNISENIVNLLHHIDEYCIIPHIEVSGGHYPCYVEDRALAICSCYAKEEYKKANSVLKCKGCYNLDNLTFCLLINPDTYSHWNKRKQLILKKIIDPQDELHFTKLILNWKPRSNDCITHREWILTELTKTEELLHAELEFIGRIANRYRCHYALWQYRRVLIDWMLNFKCAAYREDLQWLSLWLEGHLSDCSAWSYREFLLSRILVSSSESETVATLLTKEYQDVLKLLDLYPDRESLWMYRRFLVGKAHDHDVSGVILKERTNLDNVVKLPEENDTSSLDWSGVLMSRYADWLKRFLKRAI